MTIIHCDKSLFNDSTCLPRNRRQKNFRQVDTRQNCISRLQRPRFRAIARVKEMTRARRPLARQSTRPWRTGTLRPNFDRFDLCPAGSAGDRLRRPCVVPWGSAGRSRQIAAATGVGARSDKRSGGARPRKIPDDSMKLPPAREAATAMARAAAMTFFVISRDRQKEKWWVSTGSNRGPAD